MKVLTVLEEGLQAIGKIYTDLDRVEEPGPITRASRDLISMTIERLAGIGGISPVISTVPHTDQSAIPDLAKTWEPTAPPQQEPYPVTPLEKRVATLEEQVASQDKEVAQLIRGYQELREADRRAPAAPSLADEEVEVVDAVPVPEALPSGAV